MTAALAGCAADDDVPTQAGDGDPQAAPEPPAQPCGALAADAPAAEAMARACGGRVEVESERSEYSEVYVEPSGHRTLVTGLTPQRARRQDGTWSAIDTTLQQVGDQLAPAATVANVRFSTGGTGPFVTLTREGHSFALSWPTALPRPTVSGNSATYAEVLPDVDLVVKATDTGFTHLLVVKTARAAANPAVRRARYRLGGDATLTKTAEGNLVALAQGVQVAVAEAPVMWDTEPSGARARPTSATDGQPSKIAQVGSAISAGHLVLTPDASLLDNPGGFPVVVDPLWVVGPNQWAYATVTNTNGTTTDTKIAAGDPSPAALALRVGNDPESAHLYRTFMRFAINGVAGRQVLGAKISGRVDHTWKCGANRPNHFYRSAAIATTPRQTWPGPALQLRLGNNNVHANEASCNDPNMPFEVTSGTLVSDLQAFANANAANYFIAISAGENTGGLNETHTERWMRYFTNEFRLHITYNTKPGRPDTLTVDGKACASGANRPFIKTTTPTLRARATDPDGDALDVWFAWAKWNGTAFVDEPGGGKQDSVPNGGTAVFNVTGNVDGGIYTFRSQTDDSPSHNPFLVSDVTHMPGNCEWEVDISPPAIPAVTSDIYLEGLDTCPGGCGSVGQTGRFTLTSSSDTQVFRWGFTDPPTNVLNPPALGASAVLDFTPQSSGLKTLFVRAIDRAGNESNKVYQFVVAAESTAQARWMMNDEPGMTELPDDTGNGNTATVTGATLGATGRIVPGPDELRRSAIAFDGDDVVTTAAPVLADTSKSFSVSAWVKLTDGAVTRHIVSQSGDNPGFVLEYSKGAGVWKLSAPSADGTSFPGPAAVSPPRLGAWTHLTGTYDSAAHEMRLYVNGALETVATGITVRNTSGPMRIGHLWVGSVAELQVWNRVISATEVFALSDAFLVGSVGVWHMEEPALGSATDESGMAHDLTLFNGAVIPTSGAGQTGFGLRLDGVNDYAATAGQVLHTDQSFTVSAWVRPTTIAVPHVFVSQQSTGSHGGFSLYFGIENGGVWKFRMHASPTDTVNTTFASAPATTVTTSYHHLVGVFDAQKREIRLYVDGGLKATTPMNPAWQPWDAAGPLLIGRHHNGAAGSEFTTGDLDEVRVFQGMVTDVTRIP